MSSVRHVPDVAIRVVSDAGHLVHIEQLGKVNKAIVRFVC
jgi:hypothetical protein